MKTHEIGDHDVTDVNYWFQRARTLELRNDDLVKEISRLKGGLPLGAKEIAAHNAMCAEKAKNAGL